MKISDLIFYFALVTMLLIIPTVLITTNPITSEGWVFTETRSGYSVYEGQYFRFESKDTYYLESFVLARDNGAVNLNILKDGTDGDLKTITQPLKRANFIFYFEKDGNLPTQFDMVPLLVRENSDINQYPFNNTETTFLSNIYCEQSSCRFNLEREIDFFNFNFEFIQVATLNGKPANLTVNVELNTNNFESGLIERTAVHIIKRDENQNIVYRMDHTIKMANKAVRYLRVLDNDFLEIPYLFLAIWIIARIYTKATNYISENNIKLWYKEKIDQDNN